MKKLHLTLRKNWFDLIDSGIKKEEYREIKAYWQKRFAKLLLNDNLPDIVSFKNGYAKNAPVTEWEFQGIRIDYGRYEWGAEPDKLYYVILLGVRA